MKKLLLILFVAALLGCEKEKDGVAIFYTTSANSYTLSIDGVWYEKIKRVAQMPNFNDPDFIKHRMIEGRHMIGASGHNKAVDIVGGEEYIFRLP